MGFSIGDDDRCSSMKDSSELRRLPNRAPEHRLEIPDVEYSIKMDPPDGSLEKWVKKSMLT